MISSLTQPPPGAVTQAVCLEQERKNQDINISAGSINLMDTIKFLHAADIHLDSPLRGLEGHQDAPVEEIRGATRRAFDNLIDLAVEEEVSFLVIAGDLYDGDWKDYNTGLFFVSRMARLMTAGIRVFIISGNHDAASQITKNMPLPKNVVLLSARRPESIKLDDLGIIIHGQSYASRAVTDNLARTYPQYEEGYVNIGLLHTSLTGRAGHEAYAPCSIADLQAKGYDYWALGHVHSKEIVSELPWIVFPGNIQGRHIKEDGGKGAALVTVEEGRIAEVAFRELDVLRWCLCRVDLSTSESIDDVHTAVSNALKEELGQVDGKPLCVRLQLFGETAMHNQLFIRKEQWTEEFRGICVGLGDIWLEEVRFTTGMLSGPDDNIGADTAIGSLLRAVESLVLDGETLHGLFPEIAGLKSKLPAEIYHGDTPFLDSSPEQLAAISSEVKALLIAKLLHHGPRQ